MPTYASVEMVIRSHSASSLLQKSQSTLKWQSHSHAQTPWWLSCKALGLHREQFGVQSVAQGHFDIWTWQDGDLIANVVIGR